MRLRVALTILELKPPQRPLSAVMTTSKNFSSEPVPANNAGPPTLLIFPANAAIMRSIRCEYGLASSACS